MRAQTMFLAGLLLVGLVLLGWHRAEVPVPDRLGTSRAWTDAENAALFQPVPPAAQGATTADRDQLFDELGRKVYAGK